MGKRRKEEGEERMEKEKVEKEKMMKRFLLEPV